MVIREFVRTKSAELRREVVSHIQSLGPWAGHFVAKPVLDASGLELSCCDYFCEADRCAVSVARMLATAPTASGGWGGALDSYWAARHRPVFQEDWREPTCSGTDESTCYKYGFCVCCEAGRKVQRFRNSVLASIKELAPRRSRWRDMLVNGFIVMRLKGTPVNSALAGLADDDPDIADLDSIYTWWHISDILLSPYSPVVQVMGFAFEDDRNGLLDTAA
eukprot:9089956-Pyramimonas_sp.AAC.1